MSEEKKTEAVAMVPTVFEAHRPAIDQMLIKLRVAIESESKRLKEAPNLTLEQLITAYAHVREFHDLVDEVKKEVYHVMNSYKESVVPQRLLDQGIKSFSTDDWRAGRTNRVSVTMLDKDKALKWLKENGLADIVQETANAQTLGKLAEDRAEQGLTDFPDDLFKTTVSMSSTLTRLK